MLDEVNVLTLISSESCNLNCKYCTIAEGLKNNPEHLRIVKELKESLATGKYLDNIDLVVKKYNIDKNKITHLALWGQEPTITLNEITNLIPRIHEEYPNIYNVFFSTNGVSYYERIVNLAKMLDDTLVNQENPTLDIQLSFDGTELTEKNRGIPAEIILNNLTNLLKELNKIKFKRLQIMFKPHNVFTIETAEELLLSDKKFYEYFNDLKEVSERLSNCIENENVKILPYFLPTLENPANATVEQGKIYARFFQKCIDLHPEPFQAWENLTKAFSFFPDIAKEWGLTVEDIISKIAFQEVINDDDARFQDILANLSRATFCGWGTGSLEMRYDGTVMHCHNAIYGLEEQNIKDRTGLKYDIHKAILEKNYFPNLLTSPIEDVKKFYEKSSIAADYSFPWYYSETLSLMALLLRADQISPIYKEKPELLLRHAFIMCMIIPCWDANLITTGSGLGKYAGWIRLHCNGFIDYIDELWRKDGV